MQDTSYNNLRYNSTKVKYKILIAEDDAINYMYLEIILKEYFDIELELVHAKNGKEAVELCNKFSDFSLVLMDVKMPIMNGLTAAEIIKSHRPNLPVIVQSAFDKDIGHSHMSLFEDFVPKPIKKNYLVEILKKYIKLN